MPEDRETQGFRCADAAVRIDLQQPAATNPKSKPLTVIVMLSQRAREGSSARGL